MTGRVYEEIVESAERDGYLLDGAEMNVACTAFLHATSGRSHAQRSWLIPSCDLEQARVQGNTVNKVRSCSLIHILHIAWCHAMRSDQGNRLERPPVAVHDLAEIHTRYIKDIGMDTSEATAARAALVDPNSMDMSAGSGGTAMGDPRDPNSLDTPSRFGRIPNCPTENPSVRGGV